VIKKGYLLANADNLTKLFTCNHFVLIFYPDSILPNWLDLASFTTERIFRFASALLDIAIQCNDENRSTIMKMNKLATILLTTTLTLASGAAFAANGQANAAADAGAVAPGAKENLPPNNVSNDNINTGNTNAATGSTGTNTTGTSSGGMLHSNGGASTSADGQHMDKDDIHKNTMCKDGRCPDVNKKVETGDGMNNDVDTKTDGTSQ